MVGLDGRKVAGIRRLGVCWIDVGAVETMDEASVSDAGRELRLTISDSS